jgi:hypothetical protein
MALKEYYSKDRAWDKGWRKKSIRFLPTLRVNVAVFSVDFIHFS